MRKLFTILTVGLVPLCQINAQDAMLNFDGNAYNVMINSKGNHFWDYNLMRMAVPTANGAGSIFNSTVWIGGIDEANQLHFSGERYLQTGRDFDAGPVSGSYLDTEPYHRLWKVNRSEIEDWLSNGGSPAEDIEHWPGNGRSEIPYSEDAVLAPFVDVNGDGVYDIADLDYPKIRGDQAVYFIYNDDESLNTESGGTALKVEIRGMAYGFSCSEDEALNQTLFMHYEIYNRSENNYKDVYVGLWNDFDLGYAQDDQLGCDPLRNLFYVNNGDNFDEDGGGYFGYGSNLAAQGVKVLRGMKMDNDNTDNQPGVLEGEYANGFGFGDGIVDNEYIGLGHFGYHSMTSSQMDDPRNPHEYYNSMSGFWNDGTPRTYGGTGFNPGNGSAVPARFMFPDDHDTLNFGTYGVAQSAWSETSEGILPGDRRGVASLGPVSLDAGSKMEFDIAYIFAGNSADRLEAVDKLRDYADHIQALFDSGTTPCGDFEVEYPLGVSVLSKNSDLKLFPNPSSGQVFINPELGNKFDLNIYSLDGKLVSSMKSNHPTITIDVSDFSNGIYFVTASGEYLSKSIKLIVNQ